MAARRTHRRIYERPVTWVAAGLVVAAGAWLWLQRAPSESEHNGTPMTAVRGASQREPALRRMVPPTETRFDDPGPSGKPAPPTGAQPPVAKPAPGTSAQNVTPVPPPSSQPAAGATSRPAIAAGPESADRELQAGLAARQRSDLVAARDHLNRALQLGLPPEQAASARRSLAELADRMIFGRGVVPGDPLVTRYTVRGGDTVGQIAQRHKITEDYLARINNLVNKNFIRQGNRLKVVQGPFHAAIDRSDHEMHIYLQDVYVRTFRVALGVDNSTPTGKWKVVNHQRNPGWTDPRTGKRWLADDPQNPIGERWIGLEGVEGDAIGQIGYGIHGTIEPEKIGQDVSMGCVRLAPDDIKIVYELLLPGESYVTISD